MSGRMRLLQVLCVCMWFVAACGEPPVPWTGDARWSPDGTRAAVLGKDGLYLSNASGALSDLLVEDAYDAAWISDSQRLVVASRRTVNNMSALADALGPEATRALVQAGEVFWQQVRAPEKPLPVDDRFLALAGDRSEAELDAIFIYLRETHGDEMFAFPEYALNEEPEAALDSLRVWRVVGDRLELETTLYENFEHLGPIVPDSRGLAVAFVAAAPEGLLAKAPGEPAIRAVLLDGSAPQVLVEGAVATSPDWTPDGRTLIYLRANPITGAGEKPMRIGALVKRRIFDRDDRLQVAAHATTLVDLLFEASAVRALPDGRVLFHAAGHSLPAPPRVLSRAEIYVVDRGGTEVFPLSRTLGVQPGTTLLGEPWFSVSPDVSQILFRDQASIAILTLRTGHVERIDVGNSGSGARIRLPAWRRPGEFSYVEKIGARNELVLRSGDTEAVLSSTWPNEVLGP